MALIMLGNSTCFKRVTRGSHRGSVSGPMLWNIVINDLIELLSTAPNVRTVVYADDLMIIIQGPSNAAILNTLQNTLLTIEKWCSEHRLEISKEKSALMPMFTRNRDEYKRHPTTVAWGINVVSKMRYLGVMIDCKLDWFPHAQHLEIKLLRIRNSLVRCSKATWGMSYHNLLTIYKHAILPALMYASAAWSNTTTQRARSKLLQIQRSYLIFITKAYKTVSSEALSAIAGIMPLDLAMLLHNDIRSISRGQPTNATLPEIKKIEIPSKIRNIHPKDNHIQVDLSGAEGKDNVSIYTDGSKTEHHVGASMVVMEKFTETCIETQRLNTTCTVFQAELCGIAMAVEWIQRQRQKSPSYAINVDSKTALLAIANKSTTHPLAVAIRRKAIELSNSTSLKFHWVKGHAGLSGNERADYLAKTAASYNITIAYNAIPINRGKKLLEEYYTNIWNAIYINSSNASHTKQFIPTIHYRLSLSLWPNFILTQFLTNHGKFRAYLYKMKKKKTSPICNCPEKAIQTAGHLMTECSLFSRTRPAVLHNLPPHLILKLHIHTASVSSFLSNIFHSMSEQLEGNQAQQKRHVQQSTAIM